ncbi:winged helix-turn-helix transcriptional regulator [Nitrobacter sp. JJSN]|uniref:winged helix-turn-helix transcriptional regulator n=1 Tax=Nitrobacter sp. JJSN TaxID=3453033 RepID=UPI003F76B4B8
MQTADVDLVQDSAEDDRTLLAVLDVVERNASITQRTVASELNIALGLANSYLKRCVRKGLIKVSTVPARRYAYYLTPHGFAEKSRLTARYLSDSFSFFRQARSQCGEVFATAAARGQKRLILIGEGELAEIAGLVVRDHPVEIAAVIAAVTDDDELRQRMETLKPLDGAVVTALAGAQECHDAALAVFGAGRVHAPTLLRLRLRDTVVEGSAP